ARARRDHQAPDPHLQPWLHRHRASPRHPEELSLHRRESRGVREIRPQPMEAAGRISNRTAARQLVSTAPARVPDLTGGVLERRLGPLDAAAIVVSNVIGGGIFFVPMIVAQLVPSGPAIMLVWLLGGMLAFAGAMAYAELAALRPRAGGEYVYLHEAYGPLAAFLSGWTSFVAGFSGAIAASAVALAEYIGHFLPLAKDGTPILTVPIPGAPLTVSPKTMVALAAIGLLTLA